MRINPARQPVAGILALCIAATAASAHSVAQDPARERLDATISARMASR